MDEIEEEGRLSRAADLVHALATRLFEASDVRSLYEGILDAAIAITGYAQPEDRERAAEAGFDAHLAKPPSLDELASLLRQD